MSKRDDPLPNSGTQNATQQSNPQQKGPNTNTTRNPPQGQPAPRNSVAIRHRFGKRPTQVSDIKFSNFKTNHAAFYIP